MIQLLPRAWQAHADGLAGQTTFRGPRSASSPPRFPPALDIPFSAGSLGLTVIVRRLRSIFRFYLHSFSCFDNPGVDICFLNLHLCSRHWLVRQQADVCIVSLTFFIPFYFFLSCRTTPVTSRSWLRFEHRQSFLRYPVIACCGPSTFTITNSFILIQRPSAYLCDDTSSRPDTSHTSSSLGQVLLLCPERITRYHPKIGAQQPRGPHPLLRRGTRTGYCSTELEQDLRALRKTNTKSRAGPLLTIAEWQD